MNETQPPVEPPDALEEAYRKASAADAGTPSEAIRQRILAHARTVAESRRPAAQIPVGTPAANDRYWWRGIAAGLAVAAIAVALWLPRERREAALETAPQAETRVTPSPEGAPEAPAAAPAPQPSRDSLSRESDRFAGQLTFGARSKTATPQVPLAGKSEVKSATPSLAQSAPPAARAPATMVDSPVSAQVPRAQDEVGPARVAAALPPQPPPAAAAPAAAAKIAPSAVEDVVVTGARTTPSAGTQSAPIAAVSADVASPAEAKLLTAVKAGNATAVRALVPRQIGLESRDSLGRTPLMQAVIAGQPEIVRYLIGAGADVNAVDAEGATPLARARAAGRTDLTGLLEAAGAH